MTEDHGFLARWSRRKSISRDDSSQPNDEPDKALADERREPAEQSIPGTRPADALSADDSTNPSREPAAEAKLDLPPIDTLSRASDFAPFMRAGVPDTVRVAALRRLWSIDPQIRNFVGPARDYAWDWNVPGDVPGSGPLLPTDDVKRLVAQIFGEERTGPEAIDPNELAPPATVGQGSEHSSTVAEAPDPEVLPNNPAAQQTESLNVAAQPEDNPKIMASARIGRHGGAVPK